MFSFFSKLFIVVVIGWSLLVPSRLVLALGDSQDNYGLDTTADYAEVKNLSISSNTPLGLVAKIINISLSFLAVIFFGLVLYAGFKWMIAFGKAEDAEKSKSILEAALIGVVLVMAAYAISRFVFTGMGFSSSISTTTASNTSNSGSTTCTSVNIGKTCATGKTCQAVGSQYVCQ